MSGKPEIKGEWVFVCDRRGRVVFMSPDALAASGMDASAARGMDLAGLVLSCLGSSIAEASGLEDLIKRRQPVEKRLELIDHKPGVSGNSYVDMMIAPLSGEDDGAMVLTLRDVTAGTRIEGILERYAEGLTVLYEMSGYFLGEGVMADVLSDVMEMIRSYYGADIVQVLVPAGGEGDDTIELLSSSGSGASPGLTARPSADSIESRCMRDRCPVVIPDMSAADSSVRRAEFLQQGAVQSGICVPMMVDYNVLGVLSILYRAPRPIDTAELWYLNVLANTLAVFAEKERSFSLLAESESFLSSVLEGIGEGVLVIDPDLRVLKANKEYLDSVGLELGDVVGMRCYQVSHGETSPCKEEDGFICTVRRVFETGRPHASLHNHLDGKGRIKKVRTKSYPILDPRGKVVAVVETLMDVTDSIMLEKDLEKRVHELEEFYDMAVGRELRMMELKDEIEGLREELSRLRDK